MEARRRLVSLEGNLRILALQTILSQLGFGMFYVVWQPYLLALGVSVVELGLAQTAINLSSAAGSLLWGLLSDEMGRKPIIIFSYLCRVLSLVALIYSQNPSSSTPSPSSSDFRPTICRGIQLEALSSPSPSGGREGRRRSAFSCPSP